jgi:hypothetical protein
MVEPSGNEIRLPEPQGEVARQSADPEPTQEWCQTSREN